MPIIYLIVLAFKDNGQIYGRFWSLPDPYRFENFALGWKVIGRPIFNSIITSGSACVVTIVLPVFPVMCSPAIASRARK